MASPKIAILIVAGGSGARMGGEIPKQYQMFGGVSVLRRTLLSLMGQEPEDSSPSALVARSALGSSCEAVAQHGSDNNMRSDGAQPSRRMSAGGQSASRSADADRVEQGQNKNNIYLVIHPGHRDLFEKTCTDLPLAGITEGGEARQDSVYNGLKAMQENPPEHVLIHDAARPFASPALVQRVINGLSEHMAVIPALPIADTLKCTEGPRVADTLERAGVVAVQTPQGFDYKAILAAHEQAKGQGLPDDAAVMEFAGHPVHWVTGERQNFKLTTQEDWAMAETIVTSSPPEGERASQGRRPQASRGGGKATSNQQPATSTPPDSLRSSAPPQGGGSSVGFGYDVHRLAAHPEDVQNPVIRLGGVNIPHTHYLEGHSDADVLLHALTDALLGAVGAGDIGQHFPPSDTRWQGADSAVFVAEAVRLVAEEGAQIAHVDLTLICEAPKIGPHREAIREAVAGLLGVAIACVNIKATTTEGLGFTGRSEGIAAHAVVSVCGF